jgi:hypothetical protein
MLREPELTFEGALRILGRHESRLIGKLDSVLGGVILAAGAGVGVAAAGGPVLAPAAMFAAVWGFTEQKNQAIELLRQAISAVSGRLARTRGYERRQLIAAAHTTIVVAAFFESFQEHQRKESFDRLEITDAEKETLIAHRAARAGGTIYDVLYAAEVPAPSAARGFEENVLRVENWCARFTDDLIDFLHGLSAAEDARFDWRAIIDGAVERYRSHFLALAAKVPEFMIWAMLREGAATRAAITGLRADMGAALDASRDALGRLEALLALDAVRDERMPDVRVAVSRANGGILEQPVIPPDAQGSGPVLTYPTAGEIYINPRYRLAPPGKAARPADDQWWNHLTSRDDFDLMLAGYITAPDAARLPMLLLGHPGAGKSMLTKIFAARLPASAYTVVRVPLRRVGANAPVLNQIEQALSEATNGRVASWWQLADQSEGTVRVVLLDGLDELLQATRNDRSGYLQEVMDFQRREAEQEHPVVIVVTSRTVVADRVDVPPGTSIVKLDDFDESDIEEWLTRWRRVNAGAIASGTMRELTADCVIGSPVAGDALGDQRSQAAGRPEGGVWELAKQPLLLLMLAIYAADPALPRLTADLATADLYHRLLESFARREAAKDAGQHLRGDDLDQRLQDHLDRLAIAALAMFNRGRQDIGEEELGTDLAALSADAPLARRPRPVEAGRRVIGEFFFVHAAEAQPLTGPGGAEPDRAAATSHREPPRRSYEFLHATFGEYLVASRVMSEIAEVAARAFAGRRGPADPDDDLLYALLSHQPLAARQSTLTFAEEVFASMHGEDRRHVLEVLEMLIGTYRHRHGSDRYASYRPTPLDRVRELACYSANLVALRATLEPDGGSVPLRKLLRTRNDDAHEQWRSTVRLWQAGLDADGMQSMLAVVELSHAPVGITVNLGSTSNVFSSDEKRLLAIDEISIARLTGDRAMEQRLRYGSAVVDNFLYSYDDDAWIHQMASWLIPAIAGKETSSMMSAPPEGTPEHDIRIVADLIFSYLKIARGHIERDKEVLRLLFELPQVFRIDYAALAAAAISSPELLAEIPELASPESLGAFYAFLEKFPSRKAVEASGKDGNKDRDILRALTRRREPWDFGDAF